MAKLIMLKGLPASGKSTYAKELVVEGWKRVNKDDLRSMIDNGKWSRQNEETVLGLEFEIARKLLAGGFNVVADDTNFCYEASWANTAQLANAEFEIKYFDTNVNECVKRDALRGDKSVGAEVIWKMYRKYVEPKLSGVAYDMNLQDAFIFDIDGTLAKMGDRSPFDWKKVGVDSLKEDVAHVLDALRSAGRKIIIVSGRDSCCRTETEAWLKDNEVEYDHLFMREEADNRKDSIVKREIYDNNIKGKFNVLGVFDDRDQVVEMWRDLGLTCHQVNWGSF